MAAQPLPDRSPAASAPARARTAGARPRSRGRRRAGDRAGRDPAIGSMASKVARPCQRHDCPAPARAGVELSHADKVAVLVDLPAERDPRRMELCADHAGSMSVPRGWTRVDDRQVEDHLPPTGPPTVTEITSLRTLEVLTAALESEPDALDPDPPALESVAPAPTDSDDGPSTAAVIAAALARVPPVEVPESGAGADPQHGTDDLAGAASSADDEVLEEVTQDGTQLVLAAAARMARRARPVPAARPD